MRTLTAADITRVVEWGADKHALDRAVTLLRIALPEARRDELEQLPIGVRDRLLLEIRRTLFGSRLDLTVRCRPCRQTLEFAISVEQLLELPAPAAFDHSLHVEDYEVSFRLPNTRDLAAAVGAQSIEHARATLLRACTRSASRGGAPIDLERLPAEVIDAVAERIGELDPQADISFKLQCDRCHRELEASLDALHCLWTELRGYAERIQHEIHLLARAYGWSERTILEMTAARRHRYCQMVTDG